MHAIQNQVNAVFHMQTKDVYFLTCRPHPLGYLHAPSLLISVQNYTVHSSLQPDFIN